jgi:hypothetical protein
MYSRAVEVQLYSFVTSTPDTDRHTEEEDWWVQESVWEFWKRGKSLAPVRVSALVSNGISC